MVRISNNHTLRTDLNGRDPGGGVALLRATKATTVKGLNEDEESGINIIRRTLRAPIR